MGYNPFQKVLLNAAHILCVQASLKYLSHTKNLWAFYPHIPWSSRNLLFRDDTSFASAGIAFNFWKLRISFDKWS